MFDNLDPSCGYSFYGKHKLSEDESTFLDGWIMFEKVMNAHYAFFSQRGIDDFGSILSSISKPQAKLTSTTDSGIHYAKSDDKTDESELYEAVKESLKVFEKSGASSLGDAHLSVRHGDDEYVASTSPSWVDRIDDFIDVARYAGSAADRGSSAKSFCRDNLFAAKAQDGVLYIQLLSFAEFTEEVDPSEPKDKADVDAIASALNEIFAEAKDISGVILDVRFSDGGWTSVAMQVLAFFSQNNYQPVLRKRSRIPNSQEFLDQASVWLHADSVRVNVRPYLGPLVVLQSRATEGAAEHLLLGLRAVRRNQDNTIYIGTQTAGCLSDTLEVQLTSSVVLEVPNQRVEDSEGNTYV